MARASLVWAFGFVALSCSERPRGAPALVRTIAARAQSEAPVRSEAPDPERDCLGRIDQALALPALPGAPRFEARRAEILARAKGVPVLLERSPRPSAKLLPRAARARAELSAAPAQASTLFRSYLRLIRDKVVARQVLLTDGYLFADTPSLAFGLSQVVRLEDLFDNPKLWLDRGAERHVLVRERQGDRAAYVDADSKARATLLFLDRVATDPSVLSQPLHRDLTGVRRQLGFDSATVRQQSDEFVVIAAHYAGHVVPTLLAAQGARLTLACEALPPADRAAVEQLRAERRRRAALVERIRNAIDEQVNETLPFDEPRTEYGQEDGKLREAWAEAYFRGSDRYEYNDDRYWVFGSTGSPRVPQVCIDFITDTLERAAGASYAPRGQPPHKRVGGLDFDAFDLPSRRRVPDFVNFADEHADWFDVWRPERHVPLRGRRRFFQFLVRHREELQPGDIVIIYGPRDDGQAHYHSFFVVESDPLTGTPIQLASNAVRPQIRSWEGEMSNAPARSIRVRIRPRSSWLAGVFDSDTRGPGVAQAPPESPTQVSPSKPRSEAKQ